MIFAGDAEIVERSIREKGNTTDSFKVVGAIKSCLDDAPTTGSFPKDVRNRIERIFSSLSVWYAFKRAGKSVLTGRSFDAFIRLNASCKRFGLWIVPEGELEGFCRKFDSKGPKWARQVLTNISLERDTELASARDFIREIWNYSR